MSVPTRCAFLFLIAAGWAFGAAPPAPPTFTEVDVGLSGLEGAEVRWGDANGDGKLDLAIHGSTGGARWTRIYHNDLSGSGTFVEDPNDSVFLGLNEGHLAFGDYDNDGDLDLSYAGWSGGGTGNRIYRNDGAGGWTLNPSPLRGMKGADGAWFDFNNDGRPDLILVGESYDTGMGDYAILYRNDGNDVFTPVLSFPGVYLGQVAVGDFNNDGLLDLAITGRTVGAKIFKNTGGAFVEVPLGLPNLINSAVAWGDYDNDGFLDFALCGRKDDGSLYFEIYHNNGAGGFTAIGAGLPGIQTGELRWGDFDNDGDLDLLVTGIDSVGTVVSRVYRNDAGVFTDAALGLTGVWNQSSAAWGDYDNDGRLDIVLGGVDSSDVVAIRVYHNNTAVANTPPTAPTGLTASTQGNKITFSWAASTDAQTPSPGLTYNLRVGTTPGGQQIQSCMADLATGLRRVPEMGNVQHNLQWTLQNLPGGTYYYSVQAIDTAFAGSAWAPEGSITIVPGPRVTAMTPAPASTLTAVPASITLTLDSTLDPSTVNTSTVRLIRAGIDGSLGTPDDVAVVPALVTVVGNTQIKLDLTGVQLPNDLYQVVLWGTPVTGPVPAGLWTFDEAAGTAAADTSGSGNNGTLVNAPTRIPGRFGNALHFNGVDQTVDIPDADILSTHDGVSGEMSVSAWVRIAALPPGPNRGVVLAKGADPNTFEYQLFIYPDGTVSFSLTQPDNSTYGEARGGNISLNAWHHLAGTMKKGQTIKVFLDGQQIYNRLNFSGVTQNLSAPLRFGAAGPIPAGGPTPTEYLAGDIDDVRLFDHELTPDEVLAIATQGGAVRAATGAVLDGEFSGTFPSGDNAQGGNFTATFTLNVPRLQVTTMVPAAGSTLSSAPADITLTLSANVDPATVNLGTVRVLRAGTDTILGTGDDVVLTPTSVSLLSPNQIRIVLASMPDDHYRVTLSGTLATIPNRVNYWSLDDGIASTAVDPDGAANGSIIGPIWVPGRTGNALHFNGLSDKVLLGATPLAVPWTAGMWVKREDSPYVDSRLMDPVDYNSAQGTLRLESYNDTNRVGVAIYTVADVPSNYTAPIGQWVHLTFVGTASNTQLYVNGSYVDTMAAVLGAPRYYLGSHGDNTLLGTLDDVQLFSRNLTATEILSLASMGGAIRDLNGNRLDGEFGGSLPSGNGTVGGDFVATFSINSPPPPAPGAFTLSLPANAATGVALQPTFTWATSSNASTYLLEVATDAGFANLVVNQGGLAGTSSTLVTPLLGGTTYYWRVTASNAGGNTVATSAPFNFTTLATGPGVFTQTFPPSFSTFISVVPTFQWAASSGAQTYLLEVAVDPAMTSLVLSVGGLTQTSIKSAVVLNENRTYFWRVTAAGPGGNTVATGAPLQFRTQPAPLIYGNGFIGSHGGCGLAGLEVLLPWALWVLRRRLRKE